MPITIEDYNPSWPEHFQRLAARYNGLLGGDRGVQFEHVGSTAVPEVKYCNISFSIKLLPSQEMHYS